MIVYSVVCACFHITEDPLSNSPQTTCAAGTRSSTISDHPPPHPSPPILSSKSSVKGVPSYISIRSTETSTYAIPLPPRNCSYLTPEKRIISAIAAPSCKPLSCCPLRLYPRHPSSSYHCRRAFITGCKAISSIAVRCATNTTSRCDVTSFEDRLCIASVFFLEGPILHHMELLLGAGWWLACTCRICLECRKKVPIGG